MATYRRGRSTRRTVRTRGGFGRRAGTRTRAFSSRRAAPRRRASSAGRGREIRIVIEQPLTNALSRPGAVTPAEMVGMVQAQPKKSTF